MKIWEGRATIFLVAVAQIYHIVSILNYYFVYFSPAASIGEGKPKRNRKMTEKQKELMLSKMQKSSPKKKPTKADTTKDKKAEETDKMEDSIIERMHAVFNQETESNLTTDDNIENDKLIKENTLPEENIDEIRASLDSMPPPLIEDNQITATLNLVVPDSLHSEADDIEAVTVDTIREEINESIDTVASESTDAPSATVIKPVKIRIVNDDHVNFLKDITRTETELKEERKQEAKKKKEFDLDSLEENLRLMHPEENEQGIG